MTTEPTEVRKIVLDSKTEVPLPRAQAVARPRLFSLLDTEPGEVVVVSAPAGSGKSTFLSQWARSRARQPVGWLSIDGADNDPTRFCVHLIASLRRLSPGVGGRALAAVGAPSVDIVGVLMPLILDDLRRESVAGSLILDDYQVIIDEQIHRAMDAFVDHRPGSLEVVIASRAEPPLRLAARRVRGELREVSAEDLRFTELEVEQFVRAQGLDLSPEQIGRLRHSTEGWVAGLYLAALSIRGSDDAAAKLHDFEHGHRYVSDFLTAEVLTDISSDLREFMTRTGVLERFNADLARAVTGRDDSGRLLDELERANLFVIPLDPRREWFRYHHLFAELLRSELTRTVPDSVPELHRTAARWHMRHGSVDEAVRHALAAQDAGLVSDLVARHWIGFELAGRGNTVLDWFRRIGDDALRADARLAMAQGMTLIHLGRLDEAEVWIAHAESVPDRARQLDGLASIASGAAIARAMRHHFQGAFTSAIPHAERALSLESATSPWRSVAAMALGGSWYWLGDVERARAALATSVGAGTDHDMHLPVIFAMGFQAAAALDGGRRDEAEELARRALDLASRFGATEYAEPLMAHCVLARMLADDGAVDDAARHADRALVLGRRARWPTPLAAALLTKAGVEMSRSRRAAAATSVAEAERLVPQRGELGMLGALLTQARRRVGLDRVAGAQPTWFTEPLTEREISVLKLLSTELSRNEIANELLVSTNTVKTHVKAVYRKLGVSDRHTAVERARMVGLL